MKRCAVLVPVLGRPGHIAPLVKSLRDSGADARIVFICNHDDADTIAAVRRANRRPMIVPWHAEHADWARKLNHAWPLVDEEWRLHGADDVRFHPGWLEEAIRIGERYAACVVGTNDLGNPRVKAGSHATHQLVHRDYWECGTIDEAGKVVTEAYHHNYCNPPEAPILMGDCTFKALGDVQIGDVTVGWERIQSETGNVGRPRRALCYSEVTNIGRRTSPLVRVIMESGREFRCTPDHRWLNALWNPGSRHDGQFVEPRVGRTLLHIADAPEPVPSELQRAAGWLAGIYDGEGSGIYVATQSVTQNPEVVEAIAAALVELGVRHSMKVRPSGVVEFVLTGGRQGYLEFLLRIAPVRREALAAHVLGWRTRESSRRDREPIGGRRFGHRDRIVAVEADVDEAEVVSLTTTSGNYFAWGYASRNCDDEFVQTAMARNTYAHASKCIVEHFHPDWGKAADDATYEVGRSKFGQDAVLFNSRRILWEAALRHCRSVPVA